MFCIVCSTFSDFISVPPWSDFIIVAFSARSNLGFRLFTATCTIAWLCRNNAASTIPRLCRNTAGCIIIRLRCCIYNRCCNLPFFSFWTSSCPLLFCFNVCDSLLCSICFNFAALFLIWAFILLFLSLMRNWSRGVETTVSNSPEVACDSHCK